MGRCGRKEKAPTGDGWGLYFYDEVIFQMGADERFVEQEEGAIVKECVCFSDESHDGIRFIDFCLDMVLLF